MKFLSEKTKKQKTIFFISIIIAIICLLCALYLLFPIFQNKKPVEPIAPDNTNSEPELPDNPIDFASLKSKNEEIYAWIKIPGTVIDYPIVQSYNDNAFYLTHDAYGKKDRNGAIYTEFYNSMDFNDPNTLIYGHNMRNGTMFRSLHKFSNKKFFKKYKYIYIYTPEHIMTYKIIAAYKYDNRHIMNSFDFNDEEVFAEYLVYVKNPKSMSVNKREAELTTSDRLITLSTCTNNDNYRYLVQGVRISDERTK